MPHCRSSWSGWATCRGRGRRGQFQPGTCLLQLSRIPRLSARNCSSAQAWRRFKLARAVFSTSRGKYGVATVAWADHVHPRALVPVSAPVEAESVVPSEPCVDDRPRSGPSISWPSGRNTASSGGPPAGAVLASRTAASSTSISARPASARGTVSACGSSAGHGAPPAWALGRSYSSLTAGREDVHLAAGGGEFGSYALSSRFPVSVHRGEAAGAQVAPAASAR